MLLFLNPLHYTQRGELLFLTAALFDNESRWSQGVCAFMCNRVEEHVERPGILLSFTRVHSSRVTVQHTRGPGTEWYDIPVPDLLSHYMFVLLCLQTIHSTDLSGKESAPQAWIIASIPDASCSVVGLRLPILSRGQRLNSGDTDQQLWSSIRLQCGLSKYMSL